MKQTIGNACGTIAMLHSFGNNLGTIKLGACACGMGAHAHAGIMWMCGCATRRLCLLIVYHISQGLLRVEPAPHWGPGPASSIRSRLGATTQEWSAPPRPTCRPIAATDAASPVRGHPPPSPP
jgi:hypothetical protein